jgi:hypothetical protein
MTQACLENVVAVLRDLINIKHTSALQTWLKKDPRHKNLRAGDADLCAPTIITRAVILLGVIAANTGYRRLRNSIAETIAKVSYY